MTSSSLFAFRLRPFLSLSLSPSLPPLSSRFASPGFVCRGAHRRGLQNTTYGVRRTPYLRPLAPSSPGSPRQAGNWHREQAPRVCEHLGVHPLWPPPPVPEPRMPRLWVDCGANQKRFSAVCGWEPIPHTFFRQAHARVVPSVLHAGISWRFFKHTQHTAERGRILRTRIASSCMSRPPSARVFPLLSPPPPPQRFDLLSSPPASPSPAHSPLPHLPLLVSGTVYRKTAKTAKTAWCCPSPGAEEALLCQTSARSRAALLTYDVVYL